MHLLQSDTDGNVDRSEYRESITWIQEAIPVNERSGGEWRSAKVTMFRVLGSLQSFASACNRRQVMQVGAASLGLQQLLAHESLAAPESVAYGAGFGQAKNIFLIYLQGAASQFETWDPKPEAPEGIRGKWGSTQTSVPGISICEKLPKLAQLADRMALVRSMTHPHNNHSNLYTLTGAPAIDFSNETNPTTRHRPFWKRPRLPGGSDRNRRTFRCASKHRVALAIQFLFTAHTARRPVRFVSRTRIQPRLD